MNRKTAFHGSDVQRRPVILCLGVSLVVLFSAWAATASAADRKRPLQEVYEGAEQLAQSLDSLEQAIAEYRTLIETHIANETLYQSALRDLARCYEDSGRIEDGVRHYFTLAYDGDARGSKMAQGRDSVLREAFSRFQLKHADAIRKVLVDMPGSSGRKPKDATAVAPRDLVAAIVQRKDRALRENGVKRLLEMLSPESPVDQKKAGLAALKGSLIARFDRAPFRPLVLPLLESEDAQLRLLALGCLPRLNATLADLDLVAPMAEDASPEVRANVGSALVQIGDGEEKEKVIPALMKLLQDDDQKIVDSTIRSMWGQYASPQFDELLIKLSRHPKHRYNTIYFCLSTMKSKSVRVCRRLIEELDELDANNSSRGAWGLTYGVADEAKSLVEDGLLRAMPEETSDYTRRREFQALRNVATEKSRPYLTSVVENELETDKYKERARAILKDLDEKQ